MTRKENYIFSHWGEAMRTQYTSLSKVELTVENVVEHEAEILATVRKEKKMEVLTSTPDQLFIDLDSTEKHSQFIQGLRMVRERFGSSTLECWLSKSGNIHVVLTFDHNFHPRDTILWQLALGSDPERERWGVIKYHSGVAKFNHLFRPRGAKPVPILLWCASCNELVCMGHGRYMDELRDAHRGWRCPNCGNDRCEVVE